MLCLDDFYLDTIFVFLAKSISKKFDKLIFSDLTINANYGEIIQVLGVNGSGKTTLLKCLAGRLDLTRGVVTLDKLKLRQTDISFVSCDDRSFFPQLTVDENLIFFKKFYNSKIVLNEWYDFIKLTNFKETEYQKCSTGIRKRVAILRGILKESKIYVFDEPFSNMDPEFKEVLKKIIFDKLSSDKVIIIFSSNIVIRHKKISQNIYV